MFDYPVITVQTIFYEGEKERVYGELGRKKKKIHKLCGQENNNALLRCGKDKCEDSNVQNVFIETGIFSCLCFLLKWHNFWRAQLILMIRYSLKVFEC